MTNRVTNPKVDSFLKRSAPWEKEFTNLREIILETEMTEELKWGQPCYTINDANVVLMHGFKSYCALLFIKGSLLKDPQKILIQQTENVQAGRQIRFTSLQDVLDHQEDIRAYLKEAIEVEKAGLEVPFKKVSEFSMPEELEAKFYELPDFKAAFYALTPGRQRAYLLYFSGSKQPSTRNNRIEKYVEQIMDGKGIND
ncbi:MAG: hypothetical protein HGB31_07050 [Erysipelotrichaceae bacterium]|nr:hypothetical protein [Erysipelotrichaceae bacterium]